MNSVSSKLEFGKDMGLMSEVVVTGRKVGADRHFWATLAHNEELFRQIVSTVGLFADKQMTKGTEAEKTVEKRSEYDVVIDYSQSLNDMIKAGKYNWVNSDITDKHFPIKGKGKQEKEIVLFHFNRNISSDDAIAEIEKQGFCPARIEELLALGIAYPELQKQFPIVALVSVWQDSLGYRSVPCLDGGSDVPRLSLDWFGNDWDGLWRFAAVCK